jgi:hypothetical protein
MIRVSRSWSAVATGSFVDMQISSCSTFLNIAAYRRPMISARVMLVIAMVSTAAGTAGRLRAGAFSRLLFVTVFLVALAPGLASFREAGLRAGVGLIGLEG